MIDNRRYDTTGRSVYIFGECHRRIPKLVGQVAPQALPDNR